ncbi:MAG: hypothetical protein U5L04_01515 [Trueperaceae bacterium]|nr:hypothetical protein [Trueperaceae bacterium]
MKRTMTVHRENARIGRQIPDDPARYWMLERTGKRDMLDNEYFSVCAESESYDIACELVEHGHAHGATIVYDPARDTAAEFNGEHFVALW